MITSLAAALAVLNQDANLMVCMEINGTCWIREGVRGKDNVLVADGRFVERISQSIYDEITPTMGQENCSEFFQPRASV
ncbi:MAG: hypothetical protein ACYC4S_19855 [Rhodoferax sp.]